MKQKFNDVILMIAVAVGILAFLWLYSSRDKETVVPIPETGLHVVKSEHTIYGPEEDVTFTFYFLLNENGDTLAWKSQEYNPFINARGVVYVPKKGIYDCRGNKERCILPLEDYSSNVEIVNDGEKVQIFLGRPPVELTKLGVSSPNAKHYTYDLATGVLSAN